MNIRDCMKRDVVSIAAEATLAEAARVFVERHVGLLPVLDAARRPIGALGLRELLTLELPAFVQLVEDVDFVHDFGAVETTRPDPKALAQPVTTLMRPATTVREDCGLLRAYALMQQGDLHDLPVVGTDGALAGIASRVDVGTAILATWKAEGKPTG